MHAKFTEGSILRHICTMTFASTAGLIALFLVDLVDLYWLSLLGETELTAAIGFAGSILFFTLSISIGLSIGMGAVVSQTIGQGNKNQAASLVTHIIIGLIVITIPIAAFVIVSTPWILEVLGASGRSAELAQDYLYIVLASMPIMAIGMAASGVMRALGKAKESMYLTLLGSFVNAVLDPILIFGLGWGIEGAALATAISRVAMLAYGIWQIFFVYQLLGPVKAPEFFKDIRDFFQIATPAVFTNLATPIGVAYVTATMAQFGDSAVAGNAIISKLQPLAFAGLFALSGSIGPIAGQNLGANKVERIRETLTGSLQFTFIYSAIACGLLFVLTPFIVNAFNAEGDAALVVRAFCYGLSIMFLFNGITFATNALFNNLKVAHWATAMNFSKATIFTIPFVSIGATYGPVGILAGLVVGASLIAAIGVWLTLVRIRQIETSLQNHAQSHTHSHVPSPTSAEAGTELP